jgi:hypothetical protein
MASVILSSVGGGIGSSLLPGLGSRLFGTLGTKIGTNIDRYVGLSASSEGSRLTNLRVSDSQYGKGIPVAFGQTRVEGNFIWASDIVETKHAASALSGKGGLVSSGSSTTTYSYSIDCAIALTDGEIGGVLTIWADTKIIYQNGVWSDGLLDSATLYKGTATQEVDPIMESYIGSGAVPAYRGLSYMVLQGLQLKSFGNRLPSLTFEILPANTVATPAWLGYVRTYINQNAAIARSNAMPPIVIGGSSARASRVLIGGFTKSGSTLAFTVADYDVTGEAPALNAKTIGDAFSYSTLSDASWAVSPDGRFVAFYCQDNGNTTTYRFVIFDAETRKFGSIYSYAQSPETFKQVYWIDPLHFIISDVLNGVRGVRLFARSGLNIVDLGFTGVWGAGTASSLYPFFYSQFIPVDGALLHIVSNGFGYFTSLLARPLYWQNNSIAVGDVFSITSNYTQSTTGSGATAQIIKTATGEWTIVFTTSLNVQLMSFRPTATGVTTVRPWQSLTHVGAQVMACDSPVRYGDRLIMVQRRSTDNYYRLSEISLDDAGFSWATDDRIVPGYDYPCLNFSAFLLDGTRLLLQAVATPNYEIAQLAIIERCQTGDTLDHVTAAILTRAGYGAGDFDVSALSDTSLNGYVLDDPMTAAKAIEPLQVYQPFDLIETSGRLRAVLRGNTACATIDNADLQASTSDKIEPPVAVTRLQELDLPLEITVDYIDASRDYETGTQRARRLATRGAKAVAKLSLPIVATASKAKQIAEARLYSLWSERDKARIFLSRKHLALDPSDVVSLDDGLMRIESLSLESGVLAASGSLIPDQAVTSDAEADVNRTADNSTTAAVASIPFIMDIPLLRAEDNQPGFYVAFSGLDGWKGGSLWRSPDNANYTQVASFDTAAVAGIATTALAAAPSEYLDRGNSLTIQLYQGSLASCAEVDLLNGMNAALVGDEIIQFQSAVLTAPGQYTLSMLLRGRRGTEAATSTHAVGERFVLLNSSSVEFMPCLLTDRGKAYYFKALSHGQSLSEGAAFSYSGSNVALRPFAPSQIRGNRTYGTGSDLTLSWVRRARINADWVDYIDTPLDEDTEQYDVEIYNGATLIRSFIGLNTPTVVYTAAQQTADFGASIPSGFTVKIYQIGTRYGRGNAGTAII